MTEFMKYVLLTIAFASIAMAAASDWSTDGWFYHTMTVVIAVLACMFFGALLFIIADTS